MASAIVPLVAALAPEIISLIANLVNRSAPVAEEKYGGGTGPVKFGDVFAGVIQALNSAAIAGQIPKELPSDDLIKVVIQAVVSSMNLTGALTPSTAPLLDDTHTIKLTAGNSVTIMVPR